MREPPAPPRADVGAGPEADAAADGPAVRRCTVVEPPPGWPELHVLAVAHPASAAGDPDRDHREAARRRVRRALLRHAPPGLATGFVAGPRPAPGAARVSVAHGRAVSLVAWCLRGRVGVDLVELDTLEALPPQEPGALAGLYLGPEATRRIVAATGPAEARRAFAAAWSGHEAALKCAGAALVEWSEGTARALDLARHPTAPVVVRGPAGPAPAAWIASIAWRPGVRERSPAHSAG